MVPGVSLLWVDLKTILPSCQTGNRKLIHEITCQRWWLFCIYCTKPPGSTIEKFKSCNFDGPQIRRLLNDQIFQTFTNERESCTWNTFVEVVNKASGNTEVCNLLSSLQDIGVNMGINLQFLCNYLDHSPKILVMWVMSKRSGSIRLSVKWKYDTKRVGTLPF